MVILTYQITNQPDMFYLCLSLHLSSSVFQALENQEKVQLLNRWSKYHIQSLIDSLLIK